MTFDNTWHSLSLAPSSSLRYITVNSYLKKNGRRENLQFHSTNSPTPRMLNKRLVMFPLPYVGHLNPMLELANILHGRGFFISIIHTRFNSPDSNKHPDFNFHPIDDGLSADDTVSGHDVSALVNKINTTCVDPLRECLTGLMMSYADLNPVVCLIADATWYFSQSVADSLKLPRFVLRTGSLASVATYAALPVFREKGYFDIQDTQPEELVTELPPLRVKDMPRIKGCDSKQLYKMICNATTQAKASQGLICNTFQELEHRVMTVVQKHYSGTPIFSIGPFHKCVFPSHSENSSVITWLNSQSLKSVLYVSFGSLASIDQTQCFELAWGLADSNQPFLWVVRSDLVRGTNGSSSAFPVGFLEKVAERACIVDWAPQKEVLAHRAVGGFWTHSGWNSTLESVCEGVPMICLPCFGDQMVNARFVTDDWNIGLRIEPNELNRRKVKDLVKRLMVEEKGEEMRKRAKCHKVAASAALVVGGSSHNSLENLIDLILSF